MGARRITYWDYIQVEPLLSLQGGLAGNEAALSDDEVMFIVVHQIDELWFKVAIRGLQSLRDLLAREPVPEQALSQAVRSVRRVETVLRLAAGHFQLMETMTSRDYLDFRDKLLGASGFQSAQLREMELLLGLQDARRIPYGDEGSYLQALERPGGGASPAAERVRRRIRDVTENGSLREVLARWLYRTPIQGSRPGDPGDEEVVERFVASFLARHDEESGRVESAMVATASCVREAERLRERFETARSEAARFLRAEDVPEQERVHRRRVRAAALFIESYRELPLLAWPRELLDALVALEQAFVVFRQRHARMVERIIGRRVGTGGSAGVDYLDRTALRYRVLDDLWAVRALLIRREALPDLQGASAYGLPPAV